MMRRWHSLFTAVAVCVGAMAVFQLVMPYHLFVREQSMLFLLSAEYLATYLNAPAPLSMLLGDGLTQLMYLRYAGAATIVVIAAVEFLMWRSVMNGKRRDVWALVPTCVDVLLLTNLTYPLSMPIGTICAIALWHVVRTIFAKTTNITFKTVATAVCAVAGTWLIGANFVVTLLIMLYDIVRQRRTSPDIDKQLIPLAIGIITFVVTNLVLRRLYLVTHAELWTAPANIRHYTTLMTSIVATLLIRLVTHHAGIALALTIIGGGTTLYREAYIDADDIYGLGVEYYFGNHKRVENLLKRLEDKKLNIVSYYGNLESVRKGSISDDMMLRYQPFDKGLFMIPNERMSWLSMLSGYEAFALANCHNMAQHAAMLANIFSPEGRSVRAIKLLAKDNLAIGDTLAADKYVSMLDKTLFNNKIRPTDVTSDIETTYPDKSFAANDIAGMLLHVARTRSNNTTTLNYLLAYHLLTKNIDTFGDVLKEFPNIYRGRYFQEGQLIYAVQHGDTIDPTKFDKKVLDNFVEYTRLYEEGNTAQLQQRFAQSYWFYYHFATLNK